MGCKNLSQALCALALCLLASCKIVVQVPEGGEVTSASGTNSCTADQCVIEWDGSTPFVETFTSVPAEGYYFGGWKKKNGYLCGGSAEPCVLNFPATESAAADVSVYLEPLFLALSEDRTVLPAAPSANDRSYNREWAPSRLGQCQIGENVSPSVAPTSETMAASEDSERWMFEPAIIFADETFTMMVRREREGSTMTLLEALGDAEPFVVDGSTEQVLLYDDGTFGDAVAGDGVYTRSCLAIDTNFHGESFDDEYFKVTYDLFFLDPSLRGTETVTDVINGVRINDAGIFVSLGEEYSDAMAAGRHWEIFNANVCTACQYAWHLYGDVFDFFTLAPRQTWAGAGYTRVHDFIEGTGHTPQYPNFSNWSVPMVDGKEHPEYIGMIYMGWPAVEGLTHELGHGLLGINTKEFPGEGEDAWNAGDGQHIDSNATIRGDLQGPVWDPARGWPYPVVLDNGTGNIYDFPPAYIVQDGQGGFELKPEDDDRFAWSDIFLYMMGLIDASDSDERYYKLVGLELEDCVSFDDRLACMGTRVTAERAVEYGIPELIERYGAWKSNVESFDPALIRMGVLNVSDRQHTEAEITLTSRQFRSHARPFGRRGQYDNDVPWSWSTGYRSQLQIDFTHYLIPGS